MFSGGPQARGIETVVCELLVSSEGFIFLRNSEGSVPSQSITGCAESWLVRFHCFSVIYKSKSKWSKLISKSQDAFQ